MNFLNNITVGQYVPGKSFVHLLDPRTKIVLLTLFIIQCFIISSWKPLLLSFVFVVICSFFSSISMKYILRGLKPIIPFVLITLIFNCFLTAGRPAVSYTFPSTVTFNYSEIAKDKPQTKRPEGAEKGSFNPSPNHPAASQHPSTGGEFSSARGEGIKELSPSPPSLNITYEGIQFGLLMSLRLLIIVLATSLFTLTTSSIEITDGIESLMRWGKHIKLPVHEIAMMMSIALRFIPTLMEHLDKIVRAQMSRGADFEAKSLVEKAKCFIPVLVPLFVQAFKTADDLAIAMEARCYKGGEGRTRLKILKITWRDTIAVLFVVVFMTGFILVGIW